MNSPRAASMPSLDAATMWPLVSRSTSRMRGSRDAWSRISSRTASVGEQSSTRIHSQSSNSWARTDAMVSPRTSTGGS